MGEATMKDPISCPNPVCPQPQDVQKVSIIVQQGTTLGTAAGQNSIISQNALSAALAAPAEPKALLQAGGRSYVILFVLSFGFILGFFSFILFSVSEEFALLNGQGQPVSFGDFIETVLISLSISIVFGLFIYIGFFYRHNHAKWAKAKAIWDQLYYCPHCDTVFKPPDPKVPLDPHPTYVHASKMKKLLV
jgi:hypothetical protein